MKFLTSPGPQKRAEWLVEMQGQEGLQSIGQIPGLSFCRNGVCFYSWEFQRIDLSWKADEGYCMMMIETVGDTCLSPKSSETLDQVASALAPYDLHRNLHI